MERIAMEAQAQMTMQMVQLCKEKTLNTRHTSDQVSDSEKTQFSNCIQKYFEAPQHVMSVMQQGGGQGF